MRNTILTMIVVPLIAAFTAQAAVASENQHTRTWVHAKQFRNTNAYAPRSYIAVQPNWSGYSSDYTEGAMTSGIAGH
jgi:hypothetical protein